MIPSVPALSLITPVGRDLSQYHRDLARSVLAQRRALPPNWTLQWCVHFDGVAPELPDDPSVTELVDCIVASVSIDRSGIPAARNQALAGATGDLVAAVDDDALGPHWYRLVEMLDEHPHLGWVTGRSDDLDEHGNIVEYPGRGPLSLGPCAAVRTQSLTQSAREVTPVSCPQHRLVGDNDNPRHLTR